MAWRLALHIANREAWRNKGRSALVAAMIALPVAGAAAADTLWHSSQVTAGQQAVRDMGRYDAKVTAAAGGPLYQSPDGSDSIPAAEADRIGGAAGPNGTPARSADGGADHPTAADLAALLPQGAKISAPAARYGTGVKIIRDKGRAWAGVVEIDLADPLTRGMTRPIAGTAPTADDQIAITPALAAQTHKGVGDTLEVHTEVFGGTDTPPKLLRITGIYDSVNHVDENTLFARHGVFAIAGQPLDYLITVPGGVDWDLVKKLNQRGFTVESKKVIAHPPADSQVPFHTTGADNRHGSDHVNVTYIAVPVVAMTMVLLEVVLLAGPAFAVGARRRRREFGLLAAAGADARGIRQVVLADGVVLGLAGGVAGIVVGVAASAIGFRYLGRWSHTVPGGFRIAPAELAAAIAIGVLTGLAAALAPAISTGRQNVLSALTGRREQAGAPWKLPVAGLIGIGLGAAGVGYGAISTADGTLPMAAGIVVAELGIVACTPILVVWAGRLGSRLPLPGRLALRDGARNRGRTAPAVAAIMAAVAGTSAVAMMMGSDDAKSRAEYSTQLRPGQAEVDWAPDASETPQELIAQISAVFPVKQAVVVSGLTTHFDYNKPIVEQIPQLRRDPANECPREKAVLAASQVIDPRCSSGSHLDGLSTRFATGVAPLVSGGPELLRFLLGHDDKAAEDALAAGGMVVFNHYDLTTTATGTTAQIAWYTQCSTPHGVVAGAGGPVPVTTQSPDCPAAPPPVRLPAAFADIPQPQFNGILSAAAVEKLGLKFSPVSLLFDSTRMATAQEEQKADDLVSAAGLAPQFYVEHGYQDSATAGMLALAAVAGVVMLGAAAVATGLAITDAQGDLETLAAVGARPRVRRTLAGSQAAATAGLGALLGAAFGLLPAVGLIEARARAQSITDTVPVHVHLAVPWLFLALIVVALPTLASAGAAALTRSRIQLHRRRA